MTVLSGLGTLASIGSRRRKWSWWTLCFQEKSRMPVLCCKTTCCWI